MSIERWNGKVAVVTGTSSGIGLAIAKALIAHGVNVVGLSRRKGQMEESMKDVKGKGKFYAKECDITKEEDVLEALNWVKNTLGTLNILINNAGYLKIGRIEDLSTLDLENTFKVNSLGTVYTIKHAIKIMRNNDEEAHIINVNSIAGYKIPPIDFAPFNVYPASKFAVTGLTESLRNELLDSKIRVTSVCPGLVKTEMMTYAMKTVPKISEFPALDPEDIADVIVYSLGVPPHVEIDNIIITPKYKPN